MTDYKEPSKRTKVNEYDFIPDKTPYSKIRSKATAKVGGKFPSIHKILTIKNPFRLEKLLKQNQPKRSTAQRKADEIYHATWRIDSKAPSYHEILNNIPPQRVRAYSLKQKNEQEYKKKIAMHKFKNRGKGTQPQGHNLRLGQKDGDLGRKKASQTRGKK